MSVYHPTFVLTPLSLTARSSFHGARCPRLTILNRPLAFRRLPQLSATPPPPPPPPPSDSDEDPHEIPQSTVDWNKSWSDFQSSGMKSMAPEGREPVTKEQLARQKAANRLRSIPDSLPSRRQLFSDWRFWVAIILTLSLFSAFVQSSSPPAGTIGTI